MSDHHLLICYPFGKSGRTFDEWQAERQGRMTVRGTIREDIDYAIRLSRSEEEFARTMKELGYEFTFFQKDVHHWSIPVLSLLGLRAISDSKAWDPITIIFRSECASSRTHLFRIRLFLIEQEERRFREDQPKDNGLPFAYRSYCIRLYSFRLM